ncbi:hypothetical protein GY45DRAFT_1132404 [Cubamyces sp. BRFM 1775]|nr:hypothetical protein GY45DRAFT_1132404 [Cubamyces sp. BRFM 1775]
MYRVACSSLLILGSGTTSRAGPRIRAPPPPRRRGELTPRVCPRRVPSCHPGTRVLGLPDSPFTPARMDDAQCRLGIVSCSHRGRTRTFAQAIRAWRPGGP